MQFIRKNSLNERFEQDKTTFDIRLGLLLLLTVTVNDINVTANIHTFLELLTWPSGPLKKFWKIIIHWKLLSLVQIPAWSCIATPLILKLLIWVTSIVLLRIEKLTYALPELITHILQ